MFFCHSKGDDLFARMVYLVLLLFEHRECLILQYICIVGIMLKSHCVQTAINKESNENSCVHSAINL